LNVRPTSPVAATTAGWLLLLACNAGAERKPPVSLDNPRLGKPPAALAAIVRLEPIVKGLRKPVAIAFAPGDATGRMFVVEQDGRVRIVRKDGSIVAAPFVDVSKQVSRNDREQGLLGLAFHPRYPQNGYFYLNYTDREDNTRVVEMRVSTASPDRADPRPVREILQVTQNGWNHNGGHLVFGPDGKLYVGLGDGGGAGDQDNLAQDRRTHLGKMLRLDVDAKGGVKLEMIQWGHRNPWRYSFDRKSGDLYIGDVGQNWFEEVHVFAARELVGKNLGWSVVEGMGHCFKPKVGCDQKGLSQPVLEYSAEEGCSVIGGHVYRGKALPELAGIYFYADFCSALVRSFRWKGGKAVDSWDWRDILDPAHRLASLTTWAEDAEGELYLASYDGVIYKLLRR
jgi:glucose/arabinose dehydrogenase